MEVERYTTRFALKAWVLMRLRGYSFIMRRNVPDFGLFGRIRYRRHWVLARPVPDSQSR